MTHLANKQHLPPETSKHQYEAKIDALVEEKENLKARNSFLELKVEQLEENNLKLRNQLGIR